jgi:hypothetical protein
MSLDRADVRQMIDAAITAERKRIVDALKKLAIPQSRDFDPLCPFAHENQEFADFKDSLVEAILGE